MSSRKATEEIDRRTFIKVGGAIAAAGIAPALPSVATEKGTEAEKIVRPVEAERGGEVPYPAKWYPFTKHPDSDSCWALSVGPDGRIYASSCAEGVPGGVVIPTRYNE